MSSPGFNPRVPFQAPVFKKEDLERDGLPELNQFISLISQWVNYLSGFRGPIKLGSPVDMSGNPIRNAGVPSSPNDVVNLEYALRNYGASAVQPQLDAMGKKILQSARRLNDQVQVEKYSSFLNGVLNTTPTANTSTISFGTVGGTPPSVTVTITAGLHQRLDGSNVPYIATNDTIAIPNSFPLSSLTRTGGIVTGVATGSLVGAVFGGSTLVISGATPSSFDGQSICTNFSPPSTFSYNQIGLPNVGASVPGTLTTGGIYYYSIKYGQSSLTRRGPFYPSDTWSQRVVSHSDGETLVAVVVLNGGGGDTLNSAAGQTPPAAGAAVPVLRRL